MKEGKNTFKHEPTSELARENAKNRLKKTASKGFVHTLKTHKGFVHTNHLRHLYIHV